MMFTTLISPQDLANCCGSSDLLVVDCRKDEAAWSAAHLPDAHYAHLDRDLSDLSKTGLGRHPLPDIERFAATLRRWGWRPDLQVVAYDDAGGSIAARLWWMLRLVGHRRVAVLDGGFAAWSEACLPVTNEVPAQAGGAIDLAYAKDQIVYYDELRAGLEDGSVLLLDARAAPRFRGEVEPLDPIAGHIPGARNRPFEGNLTAGGAFKHADELREEFEAVIDGFEPNQVVHSCGSGVTACHNLLAMEHAGLTGSRIFAPSWSGWISDPSRPVARA